MCEAVCNDQVVIPMRKVLEGHFYSLSLAMRTVTSFLPMNLLDKTQETLFSLEVLSLICAPKTAPKCSRSHQGLG